MNTLEIEPPVEHLLTEIFETTWEKFPVLVSKLSLLKQLNWRREVARNDRSMLFLPWERLLNRATENRIKSAKEGVPGYTINETQGRISVLTDDGRLLNLLTELGEISVEPDDMGRDSYVLGNASPFVTVMEAFRAELPWTGTVGFSLRDIRRDVAKNALAYINNLTTR